MFSHGRVRVVIALLFLLSLDAQAIKIAAFGDSITRGYTVINGYAYYTNDANGYANYGGYIPSLQSQLNAVNWGSGESITVYNWGHPGERVFSAGRNRFPSPVLNTAGKEPDYVLIMEGTNDLGAGIGPGTVRDMLNHIVTEVINAGRIPVLGTLLPRFDHKVSSSDITDVNDNIKSIGTSRGIEVADLYAGDGDGDWRDWDSMMPDGLHPDYKKGYPLMANIWFDTLVRYKEELERLAAIERAKIAGAVSAANYLLLLND